MFIKKLAIDENYKLTRADLKSFLAKFYKLSVTELQATEGIHYCRGKSMEKSIGFNRDKLVDWLLI